MKKILKFFIFLSAVAIIIIVADYIYRYAQNKEADSLLVQLIQIVLEKIKIYAR